MTVRTAELLMAILMGVFSIYLMVKSTELPIGWVEDEGPGGGTWPFWLSTIMLISCGGILYNWFRKKGAGGCRLTDHHGGPVFLYRGLRRAAAIPAFLHPLSG
jgi:hypothetical protein